MRVILLNLPWQKNGRLGVRAGSRWPFTTAVGKDGYLQYIPFPFFLAYATSLLKREKKEVKLIDAIAEGFDAEKIITEIKSYNPVLIVIETSTPTFKSDLEIIRDIRFNYSNSAIVICGPHASVYPEEILNKYNFIDYVLIGEYEYTLLDLVDCLENNLDLGGIAGLAYRKDSKIKINRSRSTINNLDDLPWPERESLPIYKYNDGFCNLPQPNVQVWTTRGCPFQCSFCLWPQTIYREHKYRKRSPVNVIDEVEYLINKFNFKAIYFDDDTFNIERNHVLDICHEIIKRKIKIPWGAMARADFMDEELLLEMSRAGLYAIKYGIESANQEVLDYCNKNMDLTKAYSIIQFTKKLGVKVHLTFCLGLPEETRETIQETIRFIKNIHPDSLQFSFAIPFPGTSYFQYLKQRRWLLSEDWSDYDGNYKCIVRNQDLTSRDLEKIRSELSSNFNLQ